MQDPALPLPGFFSILAIQATSLSHNFHTSPIGKQNKNKDKDSDQPIYLARSNPNLYNNISHSICSKSDSPSFSPKLSLLKHLYQRMALLSTWSPKHPQSGDQCSQPLLLPLPCPMRRNIHTVFPVHLLFSAPISMTQQHLWHHLLFGLPATSLDLSIPSLMLAARVLPINYKSQQRIPLPEIL